MSQKEQPQLHLKSMEMKKIPIAVLHTHLIQPPQRTTAKAVMLLEKSLLTSQLMAPCQVAFLQGEYHVLDGHRRIEVCKAHGLTEVDCLVIPAESFQEVLDLLPTLNRGNRPLRGEDWLYMWAKTPKSERVDFLKKNPQCVSGINKMCDVFGYDRTVELGIQERISPACADQVIKFVRLAEDLNIKVPTKSIIGEWMLKHSATSRMEMYSRDPTTPARRKYIKRVGACIRKDISLQTLLDQEAEKD